MLRSQHYLSTPIVIANSDLAMTVPMSFANFLLALGNVRILQLPIDTPDIETNLYWHESSDYDQEYVWFMEFIIDAHLS